MLRMTLPAMIEHPFLHLSGPRVRGSHPVTSPNRSNTRQIFHVAIAALAVILASACGPGANPQLCLEGETDCADECVDIANDARHCGACGNACASDEVCDGTGQCIGQINCQNGTEQCGDACVDLDRDAQNCGACGTACGSNEACNAGVCEDDSCTESTSQAQTTVLPADIIVVVDNSGSMTDEAGFVQDSMNDFANTIINSDIDARVIMISADSSDQQGICVPAPLGSGSCPNDSNLPTFRHVVTTVGSSNSLQLILSTYPEWSDDLRPIATKTVAVISDDNSGLSASDFSDQLVALNPSFEGFKFDAIVSPYDLDGLACAPCVLSGNCNACDPCCGADTFLGALCTPLPADEGVVYKELVQNTGGVEGNLCTQDFLPAFQDMATAVIADSQVACLYAIPDPGNGMTIDYTRVNVEYTLAPGDTPVLIPNVPGGETDCGPSGGWYYDDIIAPSQVLLCPDTCTTVQANQEASIAVKFGCATVIE